MTDGDVAFPFSFENNKAGAPDSEATEHLIKYLLLVSSAIIQDIPKLPEIKTPNMLILAETKKTCNQVYILISWLGKVKLMFSLWLLLLPYHLKFGLHLSFLVPSIFPAHSQLWFEAYSGTAY